MTNRTLRKIFLSILVMLFICSITAIVLSFKNELNLLGYIGILWFSLFMFKLKRTITMWWRCVKERNGEDQDMIEYERNLRSDIINEWIKEKEETHDPTLDFNIEDAPEK